MNRTTPLFLALALLASGCFSYNRVALPSRLPEKDAPLPVRVKAYNKLVIQNGQQTTYLRNGVPQSTSLDFVLLGDGTRVEDARDLAAVVEPGSATARFIAKLEADMESAKKTSTIVALTSAALMTVGFLVGLPLLLEERCSSSPFGQSCTRPNTISGAAVTSIGVGGGFIGLALVWPMVQRQANFGNLEDRTSAFMTYNQSLRERLALDDESIEQEKERAARPNTPFALLIPAASLWLAQLSR